LCAAIVTVCLTWGVEGSTETFTEEVCASIFG
jgi:hypothetical protein